MSPARYARSPTPQPLEIGSKVGHYVREGTVCLHTLRLPEGATGRIVELAGFAPSFFAEMLADDSPHGHPHLPPSQAGKGRWRYRGVATANLLH